MSNSTTAYPTDFRGWLAKVISFNTVSRNSNLPLIYYVRDYLQSVGITDIEIIPDPKRDTHANLFATLPGKGGVKQGGIVLSGHTDVVPVDGQKWDTDPFTMVEKDGKLYGRGACDMKAFLANVLALVPTFLKMNRAKPVHIAFSYDEEVGCLGVPIMADHLKKRGFKADACLVGESTNMQVRTGSKGYIQWDVQVKGKAIHSSMALMNTSCNSIEYAAKIICKIREIAIDLRDNGPRDDAYTCPFSAITVGLIKGGIAVNTVPAECSFTFNIRVTDTKTADEVEQKVKDFIDKEVLPEMRKEYPEASITMPRLTTMPAFNARETDAFTKHVRALCKDNTIRKTPGGTEAGFFQETLNIPTVIVGAGGGAAHMANEYVTVELMEKSKKFTEDIVAMYTGAAALPKL